MDHFIDIIKEMAESGKYSFKVPCLFSLLPHADTDMLYQVATIKTSVTKATVQKYLSAGEVVPCGPAPELTQADLDSTIKIVAQVGAEPYLQVLREHPDVDIIIGGRSYDPAPFAALAMFHGLGSVDNFGPAWHSGKIMVSRTDHYRWGFIEFR